MAVRRLGQRCIDAQRGIRVARHVQGLGMRSRDDGDVTAAGHRHDLRRVAVLDHLRSSARQERVGPYLPPGP